MIGILIDVTRCTGCQRCVDACVSANQLGDDAPLPQHAPDGLSAQRWSSIVQPAAGHYVRKQCRHCLEPACVSVCPAGAMHKTPEGPVIYDSSVCLGCRYCMMACPFGIPRYEWDSAAPLVRKCTLCYERLKQGQLPACVEACPEGALLFGTRGDLLTEAHRRLQAQPSRYLPTVYGEHEVGGTSVLYVSDVSLDFLGFQGAPGQTPLPDLTWDWLVKVPPVGWGVMALMAGTYWIIKRRMKLAARQAGAEAQTPEQADDGGHE